ncbi:hypothetical protein [Nonomuraea insulae]|uniref:Chromosome partition protein Smc n=1 Tax=Nonomuraea insulae TaxID=1616787 RepID=A0ABW1CY95_9ACTN
MDLEEKYLDLEVRVKALEATTVSGVPKQSIAARFDTQYERISEVGMNINSKIEREVGALRLDMKARFAAVDERLGERFAEVDERFTEVDGRLKLLQTELTKVTEIVQTIHNDSGLRDLRIDKLEGRLDTHDERFDRLEAILVRIDAKLPDQQPN